MPKLVKGDTVLFKIYDKVAMAYEPIVCLTSNNLSETRNIIESQTKCDPGQIVKTPGSYTYEIALEGEYGAREDASDAIYDWDDIRSFLVSGESIDWSIEGLSINGATTYYGTGYLSEVSLDAPAGDEIVTFSATLMGDGKTEITTLNPN